ncbi:sporulation protein YqfC [Faecalicatena contorta]|uniref:sporulation protein YqfC n=1 Tax=Faecalicatena contorta TaxID=39482 RepID=UPI001F33F35D|nr:sporulation protein YqfC [Faecalicatena contorta]MCF2682839.1 sporulation protein YqfC [Faecalicatena contorta]
MMSEHSNHLLREKISELSELPRDVSMGLPVLTMVGQVELNIENYRGMIEYTDVLIRVRTKSGQIRVNGHELKIAYYTSDEMKINGRIESIEYQN